MHMHMHMHICSDARIHARVSAGSCRSDFEKERSEVRAWALPKLNELCAARGTILTLVDYRAAFSDADPAVGQVLL